MCARAFIYLYSHIISLNTFAAFSGKNSSHPPLVWPVDGPTKKRIYLSAAEKMFQNPAQVNSQSLISDLTWFTHMDYTFSDKEFVVNTYFFYPFRFTRDCLAESVPITRMDFTAVLPRFLSLYIMSFLSPRDICSAAQVCWHWKFLAEQVKK